MPPMAFLDHPDLVRVAPVPTPWRILGGQNLDLGCERKVDHKVGLIIASSASSDGPDRRATFAASKRHFLVKASPRFETRPFRLISPDS